MAWLIWLVLLACAFCPPSHGQLCTDPTIAAVKNLYNRDCTPDTVTVRTALPLTLQRGDTYGRNLIVYGREVTLAESILTEGRDITIVANTLRCDSATTTLSTVPRNPNSTQSFENDASYPSCGASELFCGKSGKSTTYVAPQGGKISLIGASLLCNGLMLTAEGGMGAAGQNGQTGKGCIAAKAGTGACDRDSKVTCQKYGRSTLSYRGEDAKPGTDGGNGGNGGSGGLPGSGGNIVTHFVNQTAKPVAKAGIGAFPRRAKGGAGGETNCVGASGGIGADRSILNGCYPTSSARCNGKDIGPPKKGSPGTDGPDPQAAPGKQQLTPGTVNQDQLSGVEALLPYYDQVQLDMILGEGNARYVAKDYSGAGNIFTFLTTLTAPCLSGRTGPSNCNATFAQAGTNLQQMQQGFSFYGRPNNWVPLISAQTINDAIQPLLAALKTVEAIYVQGYLDRAKSSITKQELQSYISQSVATATGYESQIASLQQQYNSTAATFAELSFQRTAAGRRLQTAGEKFQKEILSKLRLDAFLDGLQAIASIASASVPNLLQIGDIYKKVTESKAPALLKDNFEVAGGGVIGCSVLSGILKDGLSGYKNIKQDIASLDRTDSFKNFVDNEEFENFIESFKTLPGYKTYGKALKDYKNVCLATSAKVLSASGTLDQISSLRGQIDSLRLTASQANERLGRSVNPADALYSSFFQSAYDGLVTNIRAYLYQAYQALTYTSLTVSSPADDSRISDYAGLTAAFAGFQNAAVQALAKAGGEKQQFKEATPDSTFVVTQDNALNWDEGLKTGRLSFLIPTSAPDFLFSRGLVTINDVDIRYKGAQLVSSSGRTSLYTTIVHEGTPLVKARNCTDYAFVHERTVVLHAYDTNTDKTTQPATFNRDGVYIRLSPYTAWTLDFSRNNDNVDFSQVTSISLAFTGDFAALDDRACINARTNGDGVPVVPDVAVSQPAPAANTTTFAAADAVSAASRLVEASLAHLALDECPAVDVTVQVDPAAAATSDYSLGAILLDNGQLPFALPEYEAVAEFFAVPSEIPLNCSKRFNAPSPLADLFRLGSAPFGAIAGSTAYEANFTITSEMGQRLKWKLPTLARAYHVIVNVTSTSEVDLYDDDVDACFTYKCGLLG